MTHPEVWQITDWELTLRILSALVIGGLIGLEREFGDHAAGFRTHILVCLGSALIMLLSIYGFSAFVGEQNVRADPARLAAQVISGIGFLGAGTILRNGTSISGLTTAASLWVVAALGLAVGAGFYYGALLTTLLVLISLFVLNKLEKIFSSKRRMIDLTMVLDESAGGIASAMGLLKPFGAVITGLTAVTDPEGKETPIIELQVRMKNMLLEKHPEFLNELRSVKGMKKVSYQLTEGKIRKKAEDSAGHNDMYS
ncbi:MgtC/SapB family protein [Cohnella pontilimi]|uniref:MgtC/SapB family protein n=1 Tax=Cohnella pontilimi TaxID=2564100 RepID=A0A4U0F7K8_9BACL|nr:MgtC/SapB family protein [Cohnella pontilimi]TJY38962.1 MgtC/SapB family protein [Cohnella pontilimi]